MITINNSQDLWDSFGKYDHEVTVIIGEDFVHNGEQLKKGNKYVLLPVFEGSGKEMDKAMEAGTWPPKWSKPGGSN